MRDEWILDDARLACIQRLLDALPGQYAMLVDERHHIVLVNEATVRNQPFDRNALCGQFCPKVIHGVDGPFPGCPLEESVASGRAVERDVWDDRSERWIRTAVYPTAFRTTAGRGVLLHTAYDITTEKNAKQDLLRTTQMQTALSDLLIESLQPAPLDRILQTCLVKLVSIPWLTLESRGCIFLRDDMTGELVMRAQHNLEPAVRRTCERIEPGQCLCGRAARSATILHASHLDERHETHYDGIEPHGHYCVPVVQAGRVKGVINLYTRAGHERRSSEERFLAAAADILAGLIEREALRASMAQADRMASIGLLAAGVAHEINNPLTYVLYNLESLAEDLSRLAVDSGAAGVPTETQRGAPERQTRQPIDIEDMRLRADDAVSGAHRIRDIVKDLRTFSRAERDERAAVDLQAVLEAAINMAFNEIKCRARLVKDYGSAPPVLGSEGRLAQVYLNLLINAAHAIEAGDVEHNEIRVRTWAEDGWVYGEVSDTGSGIPEEQLERMFEPFFTTKEPGVGTGLGLSICHKIVTGLGGRIDVQSQPGRGTRFITRLPAAEAGSGAGAGNAVEGDGDAAAGCGENGEAECSRILVVDDEPGIRRFLQRVLSTDHEVVVATSGAEARGLLENDTGFDLILCDLVMPSFSGVDLHEWLAARNTGLADRMLFMTGAAFTPRATELLKRFPGRYIEKPFTPQTVLGIVRDTLADSGQGEPMRLGGSSR